MSDKTFIKYVDIKSRFRTSIHILMGLLFINVIFLMFLPSYFGYSSIESLSFYLSDGWCKAGEGVGQHCFGDFYYNFNFTDLSNPWGHGSYAYPPLSLFIFKIFKFIFVNNSHSHLSLNIYLTISVIAMLFPGYHLLRNRMINKNMFFPLCGIILMSAPMIMSFDRGNLQMIMTPFIYLCIYSFLNNKNRWFMISSCFLIALKPQYIFLAFLFVAKRDVVNLIKWLIATALSFLSTFLLFPSNIMQNLKDFLIQIEAFNHLTPLGILYPANLSISSTFSLIYRFFSVDTPENMKIANTLYVPIWVTAILLILCIFLFWKKGLHINQYALMYLVLCFPILLPGVVFAYHATSLVVFLIFVAVDIQSNHFGQKSWQTTPNYFIGDKFIWVVTVSIAGLLFVPWSIPWSIFPHYESISDGNMTITWTLLQILVLILFLKLLFNIAISKKESK